MEMEIGREIRRVRSGGRGGDRAPTAEQLVKIHWARPRAHHLLGRPPSPLDLTAKAKVLSETRQEVLGDRFGAYKRRICVGRAFGKLPNEDLVEAMDARWSPFSTLSKIVAPRELRGLFSARGLLLGVLGKRKGLSRCVRSVFTTKTLLRCARDDFFLLRTPIVRPSEIL